MFLEGRQAECCLDAFISFVGGNVSFLRQHVREPGETLRIQSSQDSFKECAKTPNIRLVMPHPTHHLTDLLALWALLLGQNGKGGSTLTTN